MGSRDKLAAFAGARALGPLAALLAIAGGSARINVTPEADTRKHRPYGFVSSHGEDCLAAAAAKRQRKITKHAKRA